MLKAMIVNRILNNPSAICIDQSRCLRMRCNKSTCTICVDICKTNAIRLDERGLDINRGACTECMLCVSECPSDSYELNGINFFAIVQKLREIRMPVLACNTEQELRAHVRTFCLGFLSEEHLALLVLSIEGPLQMNLTQCAGCRNGYVVNSIKDRLERVAANMGVEVTEKIRLVEDVTQLQYRDVTYNRRDFFKAFRSLTSEGAQKFLFDDASDQKRQAYSAKTLPPRREVMNRMLRTLPPNVGAKLMKNYYYDLRVDDTCDFCTACVGVCPTGALQAERSVLEKKLFFNSSLCNGCGICAALCDKSAIHQRAGFQCDENVNAFSFHLRQTAI